MKNILRQQRRSSMVAAVVTILMGVLLIFVPNRSAQLLCALLGGALVLTGVIYIFGWLSKRRESDFPVWFLLPGVILTALGLWLFTNPASVIVLIQYIFAAILIFHGVIDLQGAGEPHAPGLGALVDGSAAGRPYAGAWHFDFAQPLWRLRSADDDHRDLAGL